MVFQYLGTGRVVLRDRGNPAGVDDQVSLIVAHA
jgi:hypothetical protein